MQFFMTTFTAPRRRRSAAALTLDRFAAAAGPYTIEALRGYFLALIDDIDGAVRQSLEARIDRARRVDDFWHLRSAVFSVVSLARGESVARERLAEFDARWQ